MAIHSPLSKLDAGDHLPVADHLAAAGHDLDSRDSGGHQQGEAQPAIVHLVVPVDEQAAPDRRGEQGLELTAVPTAQPLRLQPQALMEAVQLLESDVVVTVEGDRQGPRWPVSGLLATGVLELGHKGRVTLGGGQVEAEQRRLAVFDLGHRCQHPGCGPGRALGRARVDDRHLQAGEGRPPGDGEADDSATDDHHIGSVLFARS